ncbi:hypothetical protein IWQ62_002688 [Dispira parvispora]|uniref:Mediator of RNA polymerase II transcription subunit 1 n=1 Tax=Dispira parvispora TaxID=1520584 RepID=A0A9W8E7R6_9FUNG|nr:hypothetical protein IWQ62_002688 [Dispira parvispora]
MEILRRGHGIPVPDSLFPGPTLLYWAPEPVYRNPIVHLRSVDDLDKSLFHKLWISVEESTVPTCFLPSDKSSFITTSAVVDTQSMDLDQPPNPDTGLEPAGEADAPNPGIPQLRVTYLHPTPEHGAAAQARFVAHLLPAVPVVETYARSLAALGSITDHHDFGVQQSWQNTVAYEELLLHMQSPFGAHPGAANTLVSDMKSNSLQDKFSWSLPTDTTSNAEPSTHSHRRFNLAYTGSATSGGVLVSRIPFTHPSQLHVMIQVLRQHCIFNTLFQSCFSHNTHRPTPTRDPRDLKTMVQLAQHAVSVEVSTEPPAKLTVSLTLPLTTASSAQSHQYFPMVFEITVSVNPIPRVQVQPWSKTDAPGVAKVLGQVDLLGQMLQTTCNIPLFLHWLCEKIQKEIHILPE